ncbi:MAG: SoxR reducing system RseC family protein [Gammaproteobacteria bacterium]|nr:SoxR reducing system RseC family protein [Gammaproteobacteria bacterium]
MIYEQARVIEVNSDRAVIEVINSAGCSGCQYNGACGTGSLGRLLGFRAKPISVLNTQNLSVGDQVMVKMPNKVLFISSFLVYMLPLLLLFSFSLLANILFGASELLNVLAALIGLFCGLWFTSRISQHKLGHSFEPMVIHHIS